MRLFKIISSCIVVIVIIGYYIFSNTINNTLLEIFKDKVNAESGVFSNQDYIEAKNLENEGLLNVDGFFNDERFNGKIFLNDAQVVTDTNGKIHVTFAKHNIISTNYYLDSDKTELLENEAYLNPGDIIYYDSPKIVDNYKHTYSFNNFSLYEINEDGVNELGFDNLENSKEIIIPKDFTGTELSIVPNGSFRQIFLTLNDYLITPNGDESELQGEWIVNDDETTNSSKQLGALTAYSIEYRYDPKEYYVTAAEPKPLIIQEESGRVVFEIASIQDNIENYKVELMKNIKLIIEDKVEKIINPLQETNSISLAIKSFELNGKEYNLKEYTPNLKRGDKLTITTNKGYFIVNRKLNEIADPEDISEGGFKYHFSVPDDTLLTSFSISLANKISEHLSIKINNGTFTLQNVSNNEYIEEGQTIAKSERVKLIITPDSGYYITGKDIKDNQYEKIMKYSDYEKNIESIKDKHEIKKYIKVKLNVEDQYGKVSYTINNEVVNGISYNLKESDTIKINYELINEDYEIDRSKTKITTNFIDFLSNKNKTSIEIPSNFSLDGKTINREDYIKVVRKDDKK